MLNASSRIAGLVAASLVFAAPAMAQSFGSVGGPSTSAPTAHVSPPHALSNTQTTRNPNQAPAFHVFGAPVVISAPVDAPYNAAAAYGTYAGQPGYGPNAVMAASVGGAPD
jgi:hypothetical protein